MLRPGSCARRCSLPHYLLQRNPWLKKILCKKNQRLVCVGQGLSCPSDVVSTCVSYFDEHAVMTKMLLSGSWASATGSSQAMRSLHISCYDVYVVVQLQKNYFVKKTNQRLVCVGEGLPCPSDAGPDIQCRYYDENVVVIKNDCWAERGPRPRDSY